MTTWTLSGDSPWTWVTHATVAALVPALVPMLWGGGNLDAVIVSAAVLAYFIARERADTARKKKEGTWTDQWRRDRVGDLLGPCTAFACYMLAWGIG